MEKILIDDIVPILVIMILGYLCGKFSFFDDDQRQGLNKLVPVSYTHLTLPTICSV